MRSVVNSIVEGLSKGRMEASIEDMSLFSEFQEYWNKANNHKDRLDLIMDLLHDLDTSGIELKRDEKSSMFRYLDRVVLGATKETYSDVNTMLNLADKLKIVSNRDMNQLVKDFKTAKLYNK